MHKTKIVYFLLLIGAVVLALWFTDAFVRLSFREASVESISSVLMPLFVIAVFLERMQEVILTALRFPGRVNIEHDIDKLKKDLKAATTAEDATKIASIEEELRKKTVSHADYKLETGRLAFLVGVTGGVIVSLVGVRALWPLIDPTLVIPDKSQLVLFNTVDVFLTGALLAGGSDAFHKLMALITDTFDRGRENLKLRAPSGT